MLGTQVRARPEEFCRPVGPEKPAGGGCCQLSILGTISGQRAVGLEEPRPSGAEDPTTQIEIVRMVEIFGTVRREFSDRIPFRLCRHSAVRACHMLPKEGRQNICVSRWAS